MTPGRARRGLPGLLSLLPLVTGLAGIAFTLRCYGVSLPTTLAFAGWLVAGVVLPGTLLWRALLGRSGWLVADVVAGAAVGYVMEVFAYVAARAAGAPLLVLAWPAGMIAASLLVPRLRKAWRGTVAPVRTPALWSWSMLLVVGVFVLRSVRMFRSHGLDWPITNPADADTPFHLALIAEAKQHLPMQAPWVSGEPLVYHWFVYPEMAATSWVTGIDPLTLLVRLTPLPMFAGTLLLVAVLARRLTGGWWTGPVAAVVTLFVLAPDPYGWPHTDGWFGFSAYEDGSVFRLVAWTSPTQTFGALLFAAVVLVLLDRFEHRGGKGPWLLFTLLLAGLAGAKSPYLPLLTGALVLVVLVRLVARRGLHRPALLAAALTAACTVAAQFVLYDSGANQGLVVRPLATMDGFATVAATWTGYTGPGTPAGHARVAAGLTVLCWLFMWAGALTLGRRALDPPVLLLLAVGAGGLAGVLLFGHPGGSQSYLIVSARPYLALASVVGLAAVAGRMTRVRAGLLALAAAVGVAAVLLLRRFDTVQPVGERLGWELARPYLILAGLAFTVGVAGVVAGLIRRDRRVLAMLVALCAGFGLPTAYDQTAAVVTDTAAGGWRAVPAADLVGPDGRTSAIDRDTWDAGRWLRAHTGPGDLLATNAHCFGVRPPGERCDNRRFALAAASGRRVLVEGWGFTNTTYERAAADGVPPWFADFWDPERLAANDAAFTDPGPATIGVLRDRYHVRWLVADATAGPVGDLGAFVVPRFTAGQLTVYEVA
ncbi:hypothetical protein [Dactylosporangium siamense]|uniref:Uncharacterized protein n=1 Tax=Dactylosporangium siamense TaxID=685454 RepID=A0A919PWA6_9ACTN|nr:hypothetical protein Dsi01nite_093700 [Dactylosporangium siamense]